VVTYVTRAGGDSASAQPYIDKFLRLVERSVGWPAGTATGVFAGSRKEAIAFIDANAPGLGMMEPQLYFELRVARQLQLVLQVESRELVSPKLVVVVKDPALRSLDDLKGKRLWTTLADAPRYLSKVVLDGKVDASSHFTLKQIGQALRGVRGVLRGDCEATLLDEEQLARAREIEGGADLRVLFTSPALPPIAVVAFGGTLPAADRDGLAKALSAMCGTAEGAAICKEMRIGRFVPVDRALFDAAQRRYGD
jgi:ABC-type phosphate/phosphonate transport system substrate-binding protein